MPFEKFWKDTNRYEQENQVMAVKVRVDQNPNFNLAILKQNIDNADNMSDVELRNFISRSFKSIMLNAFQGQDAVKYVKHFEDVRFLDAFIDVVSSIQFLDINDIIRCNTLCYHYIILPKDKQDYRIKSRMIKLSSIINRLNLPRLLGLGLSDNLASMLLIARYSDINLDVCVKRVDFIIMTQPKELMTEKMIEEIFKILYNVFEDMNRVFTAFMLDVLQEYDETLTPWITDDVSEVSSVMNLSVLNIIDNLPSEIIRCILMNYTEYISIVNRGKTRFSLRTISEDYYRIKNVIDALAYNESIYVK